MYGTLADVIQSILNDDILAVQNLFLPVVTVTNTPATTYAIQCAGGGEYVVSLVIAFPST